ATVRPHQTNNHVKAGRFACAIRPEQADDLACTDVHVNPVHNRPATVDLYQILGDQNSFFLCCRRRSDLWSRDRRSLANHGFGNDAGVRLGEGEGLASPFFSSFGSCRISVRLGPCVVSWLFWLMIMTVSGLVATCMFNPSCTRGVPLNSTSPVAAV